MKITEVGAEGNLNKETHIDLDFFSRDGQKKTFVTILLKTQQVQA